MRQLTRTTIAALAMAALTVTTGCGQQTDADPAAQPTTAPAPMPTADDAGTTESPEPTTTEPTTEPAAEPTTATPTEEPTETEDAEGESEDDQTSEGDDSGTDTAEAGVPSWLAEQATWSQQGRFVAVMGEVAIFSVPGQDAHLVALDEAGKTVWEATPSAEPLAEEGRNGPIVLAGLESVYVLWNAAEGDGPGLAVVSVLDPATGQEIGRDSIELPDRRFLEETVALNAFWVDGTSQGGLLVVDERTGQLSIEDPDAISGGGDRLNVTYEVSAPFGYDCEMEAGPGWQHASRLSPDRSLVVVPGGVADLETDEVTCSGIHDGKFLFVFAVADDGTAVGVQSEGGGADPDATFIRRNGSVVLDEDVDWAQLAGILGNSVLIEDGDTVAAYPID